MAEHKVYQYYQGLTPTTRGIIIIGGIAISAYIAYEIYNGLHKAKILNATGQEAAQSVADLNYLMDNGISPSYVNSQYETWAGELVSAFSGCGVDFNTVLQVFNNIQNEADVAKLISTFGTRTYDKCMSWIILFGSKTVNQSLGQAMAYKLSSEQLNQIDNILASKQIKYRF